MRSRISRPKLVWVLSIMLGLMAVAQLVLLSSIFVLGASNPALHGIMVSVPAFDWLTLYIEAAILLVSMILLFRLRSRAVSWFGVYIGLGSWVALAYSIAPENPPYFDELISLAGLLIALVVFGYMRQLRTHRVLT